MQGRVDVFTPCQPGKPACPNRALCDFTPLACWYTHSPNQGSGPEHVGEINAARFFFPQQIKQPWEQGQYEYHCGMFWLLCRASARGFQRLLSAAERFKFRQCYYTVVHVSGTNIIPAWKSCAWVLLISNYWVLYIEYDLFYYVFLKDLEGQYHVSLKDQKIYVLKAYILITVLMLCTSTSQILFLRIL